jgi:hypothetical protein
MLGSVLPYAFTLLALLAAEGFALDSRHANVWGIALALVGLVPAVVFGVERSRSVQADWRLAAPGLLGLTVWSSSVDASTSLLIGLSFGLVAAATALTVGRVRPMTIYAERVISAAALFAAAIFVVISPNVHGGPLGVWIVLCGAWLLLWMPMAMRRVRVEYTFRVARPAEDVSAYLLDQRHLVDWFDGYLESDLLPGTALGLGARFRQLVLPGRRPQEATVEVTAYEPSHHIKTAIIGIPGHATGEYTFARDEGSTVAVYGFSSEIAYPSAILGGKVFSALATITIRKKWGIAYAKLRSILEAGSAPGAVPSSDDQPHGPVVEQVLPSPVDEHQDPAPEADHVDQVNEEPHEPA